MMCWRMFAATIRFCDDSPIRKWMSRRASRWGQRSHVDRPIQGGLNSGLKLTSIKSRWLTGQVHRPGEQFEAVGSVNAHLRKSSARLDPRLRLDVANRELSAFF